jgi:hypothetical protein
MKTCINNVTANWRLTTVARAMRHAGLDRGGMFLLNPIPAYKAFKSRINSGGLRVSR